MEKYVAMFVEIGLINIKPHCLGIFDNYGEALLAVRRDMDEFMKQISDDQEGVIFDYHRMFVEMDDISCEWQIEKL